MIKHLLQAEMEKYGSIVQVTDILQLQRILVNQIAKLLTLITDQVFIQLYLI